MKKEVKKMLVGFEPSIMQSSQEFLRWLVSSGRNQGLFFNSNEEETARRYAEDFSPELIRQIFCCRLAQLLRISRDDYQAELVAKAIAEKEGIQNLPVALLEPSWQALTEILKIKKEIWRLEKPEDRNFCHELLRASAGAIGDLVTFVCKLRTQVN